MTRGYSLVENNDKIVKSVNDLKIGDIVTIKLKDGQKEAKVIK